MGETLNKEKRQEKKSGYEWLESGGKRGERKREEGKNKQLVKEQTWITNQPFHSHTALNSAVIINIKPGLLRTSDAAPEGSMDKNCIEVASSF